MNMQDDNKLMLRSPKTRRLLGDIPRVPLYAGLAVMIAVTAVIAAALLWLPFPYSGGDSIISHIVGAR